MAIVNDKRLWCVEPPKTSRDKIAINVPKGKRDVYRRAAAERGLSLSSLIQMGVEEFILKQVDEEFIAKLKDQERLSKEKQKLVAAFDTLPKDSRQVVLELVENFAAKVSAVE